jgi:hypothetical protein
MRIPVLRGVIDRRLLVNYRVDPAVLAPFLPPPFRPKLHRGFGLVGICLIRLKHVRPRRVPSWLGIGSENAAHRTAVEWDDAGRVREGVYIRRRDTSSRLNAFAGGRLFPGIHSHAAFAVTETATHFDVALRSDDGETSVAVIGDVAADLPKDSVFATVDEASEFFRGGSLGYSATPDPTTFQGLELKCDGWRVEPLNVTSIRSNFFDDRSVFPAGSIAYDCTLLMRGIAHEWYGKGDLCCATKNAGQENSHRPPTPVVASRS